MTSVLVTGPRGLLGSTAIRVFRDAGFEVYPYEGDITDAAALQAFVTSLPSLEVIVHTAAATDVNRCEREPEWCTAVNVDGTRNVRDAAASRGARFIHISTVSVFSGKEGGYREGDRPEPGNVYNRSKEASERVALAYDRSTVVRLNVIGVHPNGSRGKNFIEWILDAIRDNKDMQIFTDVRINALSSWTIAELLADLIRVNPPDRVLHLGTSDLRSKADIAEWFLSRAPSYTGHVTRTTSDALSSLAHRPKEMWLNVDRAAVVFRRTLPTVEHELERISTHLLSAGGKNEAGQDRITAGG
jgi:dTDP-4-dehydrorhamnose reductase